MLRMMDMDEAYEIKVGNWLWIVVKSSAYPLDQIVKYPASSERLIDPRDYVIWCESSLGNTSLSRYQGILTVNAHLLQMQYIPCNT